MEIEFEVAIVIVNYKNELKTIDYVKTELAKIKKSFAVIIVNNSSTFESDNLLCTSLNALLVDDNSQKGDNENIFVISSNQNLGFAKGNNLGADFAINELRVRYILFSNNDIRIISSNIIDVFLEKMQNNLNIGIIGPNCIGLDGISQSPRPYVSFAKKYIWSYLMTFVVPKRIKNKILDIDYPINAIEGYHYKLSGSFFMVRVSSFIECEMMDPATFLYCEEEILTERMAKINMRPYYCPQVKVLHEHSQTVSKFINEKKKMILDFESNKYYYSNYKNVSNILVFFGERLHYIAFYLKSILNK